MAKPLQPHEVDELAADATNLLQSKAFKQSFDDLEARYIAQLKSVNIGDLTVPTLHASMRVLEDVKQQLQVYINNAKMQRTK